MKKSIRILFLILVTCLVYSCEKETNVGSVHGFVSNSSNGEPIQGVNISLSPIGLSTATGSDGRYEFVNLQAGQYTIQAMKVGYESNTKNITVVAGNVSSGDMTLKPEIAGFNLNVEYLDFGTNFSQLSFKVINTSTSLPVSWSITESISWLTATPSSGNLGAGQEVAVMVNIDRTQIEQSTTANLTVEGADKTVVLPVNVSVSGSQGPQLQLSETSLDFGTSATSLAFYVMNTGPAGSSLNWACSNVNVDWLMITPTSGSTDGGSSTAVMATIDRTKIDGMVSTSVSISGAGSSSSISISAASEGAGVAILQLSEGSLDFGETETTKTFTVKNVGSAGTVLDWAIATPGVDWVTFTPMTGNTNAGSGTQVTAIVDRNKFNGLVSTTVTVNGANNSANISISAANVHAAMEVSTTSVDFGTTESTKTITIKNVGDEGSTLQWSIATPSVNWLTASPMSGNVGYNQTASVTLTIDRNAFVGNLTTDIRITGANTTETVTISADNSVIVTDGLVAYYDFNSQNANDWSGNYNGIIISDVSFNSNTPSGEGYSARFSSNESQIKIPNNSGIMNGFSTYSVSLWVKMNGSTGSIFGYIGTLSSYSYIFCNIYPNTNGMSVYYAHGESLRFTIPSLFNGTWHHIVVVQTTSTMTMYCDGIKFDSFSRNAGLLTDQTTYLGAVTGTGYYNKNSFIGNLDEVRVYNRALTQDEVRALYNAKQ